MSVSKLSVRQGVSHASGGSTRRRRRRSLWVVLALVASGLVVTTSAPASPAVAAIPPAPTAGDFEPTGPVIGVTAVQSQRGSEITFSTSLDAPAPYVLGQPVSCGEFGCIAYGLSWDLMAGPWTVVDGCEATVRTCTLTFTPNDISQGQWHMMRVNLALGNVYISGQGFAAYAPPIGFILSLHPVNASGAPVAFSGNAYAVRTGRNPLASQCVDDWTVIPALPQLPPCITLRKNFTSEPYGWWGIVPRGSGTWKVVGEPVDPTRRLFSQPSKYEPLSVTFGARDIDRPLVLATKPNLTITVAPENAQIIEGETVTISITVGRTDGTGDLTAIKPFGATSLSPMFPSDKVEVVGSLVPAVPAEGFVLAEGQSKTFTIRLRGVDTGSTAFYSRFDGRNDLGGFALAIENEVVTVVAPGGTTTSSTSTVPPGGSAPQPPTITKVTREPGGGTVDGTVRGTVTGRPGSSIKVDIAMHAECVRQVTGAGVSVVGSTSVRIDADGTTAFVVRGPVRGGHVVYGTTVAGGKRSTVSSCKKVPTTTVPSPPRSVTATARAGGRATVTWRAPATHGGAAITLYEATSSPGRASCTAAPPALTCTVTGLRAGTEHRFGVTARNRVGWSDRSALSPTVTAR